MHYNETIYIFTEKFIKENHDKIKKCPCPDTTCSLWILEDNITGEKVEEAKQENPDENVIFVDFRNKRRI